MASDYTDTHTSGVVKLRDGDLVTCIDPGRFALTRGGQYRVAAPHDTGDTDWVCVVDNTGTSGSYRAARFKVVPPTPTIDTVLADIAAEVGKAEVGFPPAHSAHEAFAVLLEEVDELKAHVWTNQKRRDLQAMRKEAVQVAAMAVRFIKDVCDGNRGRV